MILAILFGIWFYRIAKKHNLLAGLWAAVGALSYVVGQLLVAAVMLANDPGMTDEMQLLIPGIIGGLLGTAIAYGILMQAAKTKGKNNSGNDNLLDDKMDL
jgi:hypothetical protein